MKPISGTDLTEHLSIPALAKKVPDEDAAYRFLEDLRWGDRPVCPHCGSTRQPYFLNPKNGGRKTTRGKVSPRRVWKCSERECHKQFSVTTGTIFHGSHIPIRDWLFVVYEMVSSKNGVSGREIERKYDMSPKTAWFMLHRIREAMKRDGRATLLSGIVIADETWIGGKPRNKHARERFKEDRPYRGDNKTPVLSLVDKATGEVRSRVVPNVRGKTLRAAIENEVDLSETVLHTDNAGAYRGHAPAHESVNHIAGEYVRGDVTTNHAEGYFSQLKRSIDGTHHHVSAEHLPRYLAEFDYRYSTRKMSDTRRMERLMGQTGGRRLTYRQPRER